MTFHWVNNLVVSGITSINSQLSHLVINTCNNVLVKNVRAIAPDESPNTDGIHVERSTGVTITGSTLQTGDDCISIGDATYNLFISNIKCGPGHGIRLAFSTTIFFSFGLIFRGTITHLSRKQMTIVIRRNVITMAT